MARWQAETASRLNRAALRLFALHGCDNTSVDQISSEAGVTSRTFFRHFADKEEVLFAGDAPMRQFLIDQANLALETKPGDPFAASRFAVRAFAATLESDFEEHQMRLSVLNSSPRLLGRQLVKQKAWTDALIAELVNKGCKPSESKIAVNLAAMNLEIAYEIWATGPKQSLLALMDENEQLISTIQRKK